MTTPLGNVLLGGSLIQQIGNDSPEGQTVGASATSLVGMHGVAVAQATVIANVATAAATSTTPFGFSESQANALVAQVNKLATMCRAKGFCAAA
jgi:hypothetical protein